ncbi:MAG: hypothetical protein UV01_C0001G0104 [Parcubacteria group bacterium GW2011_GWA2_42_14]|nr:MAG: hypothetical protein UV01_C0001G0104 [Parcubacteria group bacterium GW2011_GWA2_42_14]
MTKILKKIIKNKIMSFEGPPEQINSFESGPEHVPAMEEVRSVFERLLKNAEFEQVRTREDGKGLYLWNIKIAEEGGYTEYFYMRKGRYPEGQASRTAIHGAFFDADGMPVATRSVAHFENGAWKIFA